MVGAHVNLAENFHFTNKKENTRILASKEIFEFLNTLRRNSFIFELLQEEPRPQCDSRFPFLFCEKMIK